MRIAAAYGDFEVIGRSFNVEARAFDAEAIAAVGTFMRYYSGYLPGHPLFHASQKAWGVHMTPSPRSLSGRMSVGV